ncbi:hypothetical protein O181_015884 [Austropuccinia psidii MF-1]|uniref:GPI mannosyltransferase 1 n=1 Tax=Austropuccinia psidii MF-1 TaxID=1389203 RepID=A0A9Q3GR92_9BASI|nr:hypothetical protein [Austropuccinia psidii MF-1]
MLRCNRTLNQFKASIERISQVILKRLSCYIDFGSKNVVFCSSAGINLSYSWLDIDYHVFSDAARAILSPDPTKPSSLFGSPYDRATYRYTPLLALLLTPNELLHPCWGKLLFSTSDLMIGMLLYRLSPTKLGSLNHIWAVTGIWLLNPFVINISTRGSSEALLGLVVVGFLYLSERKRWDSAAALLGLAVHLKLYPGIYGATVWSRLASDNPSRSSWLSVNAAQFRFGLISLITFSSLNVLMYLLWGYEFIEASYLYHLGRLDHRHNFSPYFYPIYLRFTSTLSNTSSLLSIFQHPLISFIPQIGLCIGLGLCYGRDDLAFACFIQTYAFVTFNKVVTSQYFMWYMWFVPLLTQKILVSKLKLASIIIIWVVSQAVWLSQAYRLEFLGEPVFRLVWLSSIGFLAGNIWITGALIQGFECLSHDGSWLDGRIKSFRQSSSSFSTRLMFSNQPLRSTSYQTSNRPTIQQESDLFTSSQQTPTHIHFSKFCYLINHPHHCLIVCQSIFISIWFLLNLLLDDACGLNGLNCLPWNKENTTLTFRCPSRCGTQTGLLNPRVIGDQVINYRPLVIGGGENSTKIYRGDSFICQAAIHAGVTSSLRGGCGVLKMLGNNDCFKSSQANGLTSVDFSNPFPSSFTFLDHTFDRSCDDLWLNIIILNVFGSLIFTSFFKPSPAVFFWLLCCLGYWTVVIASEPNSIPPSLSNALGDFLPFFFVCRWLWSVAWKNVVRKINTIDRIWLYLLPCWLGILMNLTTSWIPIDRLTPRDIQQRPGALPSVIILALCVLILISYQLCCLHKRNRLNRLLLFYSLLVLILCLLMITPGHSLRLHHYLIGIFLTPLTSLPTKPSAVFQAFLLGMIQNGIARWSFASILELSQDLIGDGYDFSGKLPIINPNSTGFGINNQNLTVGWKSNSFNFSIGIMIDDVLRMVTSSNRNSFNLNHLNSNLSKIHLGWTYSCHLTFISFWSLVEPVHLVL